MESKKILITGATGSLGAFLVRYYSKLGHQIIAQGKSKTAPKNLLKFATYLSFDLTKDFEAPSCDICIHTAALSDDKAKLNDLLDTNVDGTRKLVQKLAKSTILIHISSSSVYLPHYEKIDENLAGNQNNKHLSPYGFSKLKAEQTVMNDAPNEMIYILRPRAFYGAGDCVILPRILKLVKNEQIKRPGKMKINVSLTHYSTIAHAIDCCLNSLKIGKHIYNVADNHVYTLIDIVRLICTNLYEKDLPEKKIPIAFMKVLSWIKIGGITPLLVRSFTQDLVLNTDKIKTELNFKPSITFENQINEIKNWIKKNGGVKMLSQDIRHLAWSDDLCEK